MLKSNVFCVTDLTAKSGKYGHLAISDGSRGLKFANLKLSMGFIQTQQYRFNNAVLDNKTN